MHIGGLLKYSLIDYPPHISCVIFTAGCNFRCPYCHNPDLAIIGAKTRRLDPDYVMKFLASRKKFLDAVVISGGEPTLHSGLFEFCRAVKAMGFSVKIDTNGSHPGLIEGLIKKGLVDYLAMDVKTDPESYQRWISHKTDACTIRRSARTIIESGLPHEFRTTCTRPLTDQSAVCSIGEMISGAQLHAFQHLHNENVLDPEFFIRKNRFYSDDEIKEFKNIMTEFVQKAIIR